MSRVPDKYDKIQDTAIGTKATKGGDAGDITLGSNDNFLRLEAFNTEVVTLSDQTITGSVESVIHLRTTNADFPSEVKVILGANDMLRCHLTGINEGTVDLPFTNYDSFMNNNSVVRKQYVDNLVYPKYYATAAWEGNVTSSLGTQNNVNWVQGTFSASNLLGFTIGANNEFTHTGAGGTFLVNYWANALVGSNDRTIWLTAYLNPDALLNPTGSHIVGSRGVAILRTSIIDTDGCSSGFTVTMNTNDTLRLYVSNKENNDATTITDLSFRIIPLVV